MEQIHHNRLVRTQLKSVIKRVGILVGLSFGKSPFYYLYFGYPIVGICQVREISDSKKPLRLTPVGVNINNKKSVVWRS
jgi:hypothetical protein